MLASIVLFGKETSSSNSPEVFSTRQIFKQPFPVAELNALSRHSKPESDIIAIIVRGKYVMATYLRLDDSPLAGIMIKMSTLAGDGTLIDSRPQLVHWLEIHAALSDIEEVEHAVFQLQVNELKEEIFEVVILVEVCTRQLETPQGVFDGVDERTKFSRTDRDMGQFKTLKCDRRKRHSYLLKIRSRGVRQGKFESHQAWQHFDRKI